jgi:hypothetical protein
MARTPGSTPADPFSSPLSVRSAREFQTPRALTPRIETPRSADDWTVDKIASQLSSFAQEIDKVHARVVLYTLQETFKKAPEPSHLSSIDAFADMPSIAVEADDSAEDVITAKFKVRLSNLSSHPS